MVFVVIAFSQTKDSVSIGGLYVNQVFYSLDGGEISTVDNTNWDIAFACHGEGAAGSAILINEATSRVWAVPQDSSFWSVFDTTGFSTWEELLNSDTSWTNGAFNKYRGAGSFFDLGWGSLNPNNNYWTLGDSLYLVQLADLTYKKLKINSLKQGVWEFQYADIDGQNFNKITINKADYATKNFIYHSLATNQTIDREPDNTEWDFTIIKHRDEVIPGMILSVTGVFNNRNLWTAKANRESYDSAAVTLIPQTTYTQNVVNIGREWKNYSKGVGTVYDSIAYFLHRDGSDQVYRIIFTDFGWSATGNTVFEITPLTLVGVEEVVGLGNLSIYPNPTDAELFFSLKNGVEGGFTIELMNSLGVIIHTERAINMNNIKLDVSGFSSGVYYVKIEGEQVNELKRFVIK